MEIYLVGGAVRDTLLGLPVNEKDWVIVGASPDILLSQGFQAVGKDFPVFLHPQTREEYALARTERKTGKGYQGFTFHADPQVTLEEDLQRRDLTINAMARTQEGRIIDPYGGQDDLLHKILRHVSPAFAEDPVRILRIARLAAKLPHFSVHPTTNALMQDMVRNGEVDALVAERVWQECQRALAETQPIRFFEVLDACSALPALFPQLSLSNPGLPALGRAIKLSPLPPVRFAALMHNIPLDQLQHYITRYRIPKIFSELALLTAQHTPTYHTLLTANANALLRFIKKTDALRRPQRFAHFLQAEQACVNDQQNTKRQHLLTTTIQAIQAIDLSPLQAKELHGKDFACALMALQIEAIKAVQKTFNATERS